MPAPGSLPIATLTEAPLPSPAHPSAAAPIALARTASSNSSRRSSSEPNSPASPSFEPKEVPLQALHLRSNPLSISNKNLGQGLDSARRLDALEWLVQAFDALGLSDAQLFAAFGFLDRFAANSPTPISAGPGAFALVLAAMLVSLKVAGTQKDLERAKRLVVEVSGSSRPWNAVRRAELCILRRLGFRACTPTSRDLLDRLLSDAPAEFASQCSQELSSWHSACHAQSTDLARFLLELSLVHESEAVYGTGRPPLAAAVAALWLAMLSLGAPLQGSQVFREARSLIENADGTLSELIQSMRHRWATESKRVAEGQSSAVVEKWQRRVGSFGVTPPSVTETNRLVLSTLLATPQSKMEISSTARIDIAQKSSAPSIARGTYQPAASAKTANGVAQTELLSFAGGANAALALLAAVPQLSKSPGVPVLEALPAHHLPTPRAYANGVPLVGQGCHPTGGGAVSARHGFTPMASARPAPSENYSIWPAETNIVRGLGCSSARAATTIGKPVERSPEPLLELVHVLNMVAPRPSGGNGPSNGSGPLGASKIDAGSAQQPIGLSSLPRHKIPSVAAELLINSALRMQWPSDRRRVQLGDAVISCRDAAAVLNEAVAQLNAVADALEDGKGKGLGDSSVQENSFLKPVVGPGSVSKRRRTFGGPSPTRAASPTTSHGPLAPRGSPPVRFSGLRV